jgi:hypothetical protein
MDVPTILFCCFGALVLLFLFVSILWVVLTKEGDTPPEPQWWEGDGLF